MQDVSTIVPEGPFDGQIQFSPNPASGFVDIGGLPNGAIHLVIMDAAGRQVSEHHLSGRTHRISVVELIPGMYVLSARTTLSQWQGRLMVE